MWKLCSIRLGRQSRDMLLLVDRSCDLSTLLEVGMSLLVGSGRWCLLLLMLGDDSGAGERPLWEGLRW